MGVIVHAFREEVSYLTTYNKDADALVLRNTDNQHELSIRYDRFEQLLNIHVGEFPVGTNERADIPFEEFYEQFKKFVKFISGNFEPGERHREAFRAIQQQMQETPPNSPEEAIEIAATVLAGYF